MTYTLQLSQPFVRDGTWVIEDILSPKIAKVSTNQLTIFRSDVVETSFRSRHSRGEAVEAFDGARRGKAPEFLRGEAVKFSREQHNEIVAFDKS